MYATTVISQMIPTQGKVVWNTSLPWVNKIVNIDIVFFRLQSSLASLLLGSHSSLYSENIINVHLKKKTKENIIEAALASKMKSSFNVINFVMYFK